MEPSAAKTNIKVDRNSDKVARAESGWVASSARPMAYLRGGIVLSFVTIKNRQTVKYVCDNKLRINEERVRS